MRSFSPNTVVLVLVALGGLASSLIGGNAAAEPSTGFVSEDSTSTQVQSPHVDSVPHAKTKAQCESDCYDDYQYCVWPPDPTKAKSMAVCKAIEDTCKKKCPKQ